MGTPEKQPSKPDRKNCSAGTYVRKIKQQCSHNKSYKACREGILHYLSNFQYPLRSKPICSIMPASFHFLSRAAPVFRLTLNRSASCGIVYPGSSGAANFIIISSGLIVYSGCSTPSFSQAKRILSTPRLPFS